METHPPHQPPALLTRMETSIHDDLQQPQQTLLQITHEPQKALEQQRQKEIDNKPYLPAVYSQPMNTPMHIDYKAYAQPCMMIIKLLFPLYTLNPQILQ